MWSPEVPFSPSVLYARFRWNSAAMSLLEGSNALSSQLNITLAVISPDLSFLVSRIFPTVFPSFVSRFVLFSPARLNPLATPKEAVSPFFTWIFGEASSFPVGILNDTTTETLSLPDIEPLSAISVPFWLTTALTLVSTDVLSVPVFSAETMLAGMMLKIISTVITQLINERIFPFIFIISLLKIIIFIENLYSLNSTCIFY